MSMYRWNRMLARGHRPGGTNLSATLLVERDDEELELEIRGDVTDYHPGRISGPPEDCYPPEGGEAEIGAVLLDGKPWDGELTESEREAAEEALSEAAMGALESAMEDAAEARAEARAERDYYNDYDDYD